MRAIVEGWADPGVVPFIEPDQTENIVIRHRVCYYTINPTEFRTVIVETKVGPDTLATLMKSAVNDSVIAQAATTGLAGTLVKQDIIWPDLSKG